MSADVSLLFLAGSHNKQLMMFSVECCEPVVLGNGDAVCFPLGGNDVIPGAHAVDQIVFDT